MKKNLRIVSAAAAALLAVAPVAASAVSANADVILSHGASITDTQAPTQSTTPTNVVGDGSENNPFSTNNWNAKDVIAYITDKVADVATKDNIKNNLVLPSGFSVAAVSDVKLVNSHNHYLSDKNDNKIDKTGEYTLQATITVSGFAAKKYYNFGGTVNNGSISGGNKAQASNEGTIRDIKVAIPVNVYDKSVKGNPYVAYRTTVNGVAAYQTLANNQVAFEKSAPSTVSEMVNEINGSTSNPNFKTFANSNTNGQAYTATANDVKDQLKKANIDVKEDGTITSIPKSGFYYTITAKNAENGQTATARVFFKGSDVSAKGFPLIKYRNAPVKQGTFDFHGAMPMVNLKLGTNDWADYILNEFKAYQSGKTNAAGLATGNAIGSELRLVSSDLTASGFDANHTGLYKMTLVAKNSDQKETTLDFNVAVTGSKIDEISNVTVHADKPVSLVSMVGDTTSDLHGVTVNPGQQIQVYANDTKTVDGVEYTRVAKTNVDREHNNEWIESSYLHAAEKTSVKIMHSAKVYNKDHNATGAENKHAYNMVEVVADESGQPKKFTIGKDVPAYKLADGSGYIDSRNVTATPKKLNHNSYVYNSNGKAKTYKKTVKKGKKHVKVTRRVLKKKGTTVKTYGAAFNIKGHKMFRIGVNQYIKVANFE